MVGECVSCGGGIDSDQASWWLKLLELPEDGPFCPACYWRYCGCGTRYELFGAAIDEAQFRLGLKRRFGVLMGPGYRRIFNYRLNLWEDYQGLIEPSHKPK